MQSSRVELLKKEFASLIDDINVVQGEITRGRDSIKNINDSEKATASWYYIVKKQIDHMKAELNKIRETYHISNDVSHKNGLGSATISAQRRLQHSDLICDEVVTVVEQIEQPSSTVNGMQLEENGVIYSVISEETEDVDQPDDFNSAIGIEVDTNNNCISDNGNPLEMDGVDYEQEELHETVEDMEERHEIFESVEEIHEIADEVEERHEIADEVEERHEIADEVEERHEIADEVEERHETVEEVEGRHEEAFNSNTIDKDVNYEKEQKESESVSDEQELEQLESTQSSQAVSSSLSSCNASASGSRKSTRVSIHRELDVNYEQSTGDNGNWQLFLGQHILIRSTKDNQWYPGVILDISYRNCRAVSLAVECFPCLLAYHNAAVINSDIQKYALMDRLSLVEYRYQVLSEGKRSRVKGSDLALIDHCTDVQSVAVGSRIVGVYGALEVLYAGIVAEIPCKENMHRVLLFFDDGFAQYTTMDKIHLVCESGCNIWEEVARHSREFIQRYLDGYPIRPMVRLKVDEELCVEWRGRWMKAVVTQVDCSLVRVLFVESRMHEWLYRGSTRLEPIFLALTSKKGQKLPVPHKKCKQRVECSSKKKFLIVYDHFDSYTVKASASSDINDNTGIMSSNLSNHSNKDDGTTSATTTTGDADDAVDNVSIETDDLSLPMICVTDPQSPVATLASADTGSREVASYVGDTGSSDMSDLETLTQADQKDVGPGTRTDVSPLMKMELYKQRASLRRSSPSAKSPPSKRMRQSKESPEEFHKECGSSCVPNVLEPLNGVFNPLAIPLLNGWTRKVMEVNTDISHCTHHRSHVYYIAPCGRRLRSIAEVDKYLLLTEITYLTIDQFCYNSSIIIKTTPFFRPINAKYYCEDISEGKERTPVSCINELQDQPPPQFCYCTERVCSDDVTINIDRSFLVGCDCTDGCRDPTKCACARLTAEEGTCMVSRLSAMPGYNHRRLEKDQQSAIYECNSNCRCSSSCVNRVVQHGLQLRLQVFRTENRGWGLRCLDDIPKGTFVCTYSGDIHTDDSANEVCNYRLRGDEYFAELDYIEVMERHKEGYESEIEVSSLDYLSDEFTMQSSEEDESPEPNGGTQQEEIPEQEAASTTDAAINKTPLNKAGLRLHKLKAKPLSSSTLPSSASPDPLPSKKQNINSPLAEVVVCDSTSSDEDDEQFPCYFPKYSLVEDSAIRSPSSSPALSDKEQITEDCDLEPIVEPDSQRVSSVCTNNTLTSSIMLHSMRRKLFNEAQCYVMDAKLQGNIGRFLNHSCQPNLFVQNVFVDTHDLRFPWVAFFTNQNIKALTELTWDYNYEVGSVPDKELPCYCGASNCRKRLI